MCGIVGFLDERTTENDKRQILSAMMGEITHRGPDDSGIFCDGAVALGFRRLSIIDLAAGHQPMANEDGTVWMTFNGEIYNYLELREWLIKRGHRFATLTDSEVIIHLYEEIGMECTAKLRGMFAFVLWDARTKTLHGARDRFGIKPFYYTMPGNRFIYSSEVKAILAHPHVVPQINETSLQHYFTFQFVPDPATLFEGIYRLPPSHYFSLKDGQLALKRYWQLEFKPENKPLSHFIEGTRHLLTEAVRMHMMSDVPRGAFLSGGVDSSVIVALLRRQEKLSTYSVGYAENKYDELSEARRTAEVLGTDHHEIKVSAGEFWQALPRIVWHMDEPVADPAACALYFVAARAGQDITVVLSGEGADEVFGGYGIYREPAEVRKFELLPGALQALLVRAAKFLPEGTKGKDYVRRAGTPLAERYFGNALIFTEEQKDKLLPCRSRRILATAVTAPYFAACAHLDDISQMQFLDFNTWLSGDILVKADRMTMAHSLELRVPFLDHHVVEFAATIPAHFKIAENMTKYVLRQAATAWLPQDVAYRPKRGFPVPTREWMKREWLEDVRAQLMQSNTTEYINKQYALDLLAEHAAGKKDHSRRLWAIIVFQLWFATYIEKSIKLT
ncbi:MAG: Asparagine synthetase (glutamine-hydrolyzing) 1 [Firmicutes bacterium]|nr:Asparagine synthetase (glutamine-hydrolyzing) 1 [Bacillota bacterium]